MGKNGDGSRDERNMNDYDDDDNDDDDHYDRCGGTVRAYHPCEFRTARSLLFHAQKAARPLATWFRCNNTANRPFDLFKGEKYCAAATGTTVTHRIKLEVGISHGA